MTNKDLFNFKFVDREIERKLICNFLLDSKSDKILWVHGESGVGKTELIKYFIRQFEQTKFVHINPVKTQEISYFSSLVQELNKEKISLPGFILKNYAKIHDLSKNTISDISTKTKLVMGIAEFVGMLFVDSNNKFFSTTNVITQYIKNISKNKKYVFVFDNFQQCDYKSLEIIQGIIQNLSTNVNVKFIFITTDGTLSTDSEVAKFLLEKTFYEPIAITPFKEKEYFMDILLNTFSLENINSAELEQLFQICNGIPEKLKNFLRNTCFANGIQYCNNSARFVSNIFKATLCKGADATDFSSLDIFQKLELQIMVYWNEKISIELLEQVSEYVAVKDLALPDEMKQDIIKAIYELQELGILEMDETSIKIKHDLLYFTLSTPQLALPEKIVYARLYEYFYTHSKEIINKYSQTFFDLNMALYSYKANIYLWPQINLICLRRLFIQSDFQNINKIASRLEDCITTLEIADLLLLAECFYNSGDYEKARNILNTVQGKKKDDNGCFKYYYLSGKLYNMSMDKKNAEKELLLAQKYVVPKSEEDILTKHMLQLVLVEVKEKKSAAKKIFCSVAEHLNEYDENSKALGILLKNCSNYYSGTAALHLLEKALDISRVNNDLVEEAFIENNMGYEYFKLGDYDRCKSLYQNAIEILSQTKIHESAYPLSNLAVCFMLEHKYDEAINLIRRAHFWRCSPYLKYVLDTHLMLCYEQIGETEASIKIAEQLYTTMESGKINDPVILRKVYLNLAINYDKLHWEKQAKKCAQQAYTYSTGTSSEYRATNIYNKYSDKKIQGYAVSQTQYCKGSYFDHWLTIFSHD